MAWWLKIKRHDLLGTKKHRETWGNQNTNQASQCASRQEIYKPTLCFPSQVRQFVEETARQPTQDSALLTEESTVSICQYTGYNVLQQGLCSNRNFTQKWMIFNFQMGSKKVVEPMRPGRTLGRWKCRVQNAWKSRDMKRSHSPSACQTSRSTQHNGVTLQRQGEGIWVWFGATAPIIFRPTCLHIQTKSLNYEMLCFTTLRTISSAPNKIRPNKNTSRWRNIMNILGTGDVGGIATFMSNMFLSSKVVWLCTFLTPAFGPMASAWKLLFWRKALPRSASANCNAQLHSQTRKKLSMAKLGNAV